MLDILRQGARSWGIKIMFAMIIVVFVLAFGISRMDQGRRGAVALVNEEPISVQSFQRAVQSTMDRLRAQNPGISSEVFDALNIRDQVFRQLVGSTLLVQEAKKLGLFVTDSELAAAVHKISAFQENGRFSPDRYRRTLQSQGLTPALFEEDFRKDLVVDKLRTAIVAAGKLSEAQAKDLFMVLERTADLDVLVFAASNETATITPEDIAAYHAAHTEEFQEPAKARVRLLRITADTIAKPEAVSDEAVRAYYEAHGDQFREPEAVRARHILRLLPPQANATEEATARAELTASRARIHDAASFAAEAKAHSQDGSAAQGGDLGWFERGRMVPEFEQVAFSLPVGQVSDIVRTPFGLHLIFVEEKRPARQKPLEQVASDIRGQLARDQATETLGDTLDLALERIARGEDVNAVATALGLAVQEPAPFSEADGPQGISLKPQDVKALMLLAPGTTTKAPILLPDGYLLATKVEDIPARTRTVEETQEEIRQRLTRERQLAAAKAKAEAALKALPKLDPAAQLRPISGVNRQGQLAGIGVSAALGTQLLHAEPGAWLPEIYPVGDAFVLARVRAVHPPDEAAWEAVRSQWTQSLRDQAAEQVFQAHLKELWDKARIEVLIPELITPSKS